MKNKNLKLFKRKYKKIIKVKDKILIKIRKQSKVLKDKICKLKNI